MSSINKMHPAIYLPICKYSKSRMFEKCFINNKTKTTNSTNTTQYNNSNNNTCKDFIKQYENCITDNIKNINADTKKLTDNRDMQNFALLFVV